MKEKQRGAFASELVNLRQAAGLSQAAMSKVMEIPARTIENWETDKATPPPYVQRLVLNELRSIGKEPPLT